MRKSKDKIIADAHKDPKHAAMTGSALAKVLGVSQSTISIWRRKNWNKPVVDVEVELSKISKKYCRKLPAKVTVASVKRKWEEKYAHLNRQYEALADRLVEIAKKADQHRNAEKRLEADVEIMTTVLNGNREIISKLHKQIEELESKSWISRLFNLKG